MATLISIATGNFTAAGTWGLCDATSELDSQAANTVLTTSYVASSTFTPGAITVDAIAVKVALRVGTTGTITVSIGLLGVAVGGTEVTINCSDLVAGDTAANNGVGWYVFKFATPVTLLAATAYSIMAKTSSSSMVNLYSSATTNWSRQFRTTTTQAPAAGDKKIIAGAWTAAATYSAYNVTGNETATTDYGATSICDKGTLTAGVTAATNYNWKLSGILRVYGGGTLNLGTVATPMPSDSSFSLNFDCTSAGEFGLELQNGSTFIAQGASKTVSAKLAADAAASATSLTSDVSTGWKNGDSIVLPSTTRTRTEAEKKALSADASGTTLTIAALTNAHGGNATTGVQGELCNLTRNVKIFGASISLTTYILIRNGATVDMDYVECYFIGTNTADKKAIDIQTAAAGSVNLNGVTVYDSTAPSSRGIQISGTTANNITVNACIVYNMADYGCIITQATSGTSIVISNNFFVGNVGPGLETSDIGNTFTGNTSASNGGIGITIADSNPILSFSGNVIHSNGGVGLSTGSNMSGTLASTTSWRNNSHGMQISMNLLTQTPLVIDGYTAFGNNSIGLNIQGSNMIGNYVFKNFVMNGGATLVQQYGIQFNHTILDYLIVSDSTFGVTTAHSSADIQIASSTYTKATFFNCLFATSTEFNNNSGMHQNLAEQWGIASMKHDQTAGDNRLYTRYGIKRTDTVIFNTATPSERMTPNSASYKLRTGSKFIAVASGASVTLTVYSRKSAAGDGTAYNGNQPRLIVRANPAIGVADDTVLDTHTAAAGTWEQLSGTTVTVTGDGVLEFYVDCDGTLGWVNVDDWATTTNNDPRGDKYWSNGQPYNGAEFNAGGGGEKSFAFS